MLMHDSLCGCTACSDTYEAHAQHTMAHNEGIVAAQQGQHLSNNPYTVRHPITKEYGDCHQQWKEGFLSALTT